VAIACLRKTERRRPRRNFFFVELNYRPLVTVIVAWRALFVVRARPRLKQDRPRRSVSSHSSPPQALNATRQFPLSTSSERVIFVLLGKKATLRRESNHVPAAGKVRAA
jgi:hypothetical protein